MITIKKNNKEDITASLTIDFLFYIKEKGNKYVHFDDSIKEKNNKNEEVKNNKIFFLKLSMKERKYFLEKN